MTTKLPPLTTAQWNLLRDLFLKNKAMEIKTHPPDRQMAALVSQGLAKKAYELFPHTAAFKITDKGKTAWRNRLEWLKTLRLSPREREVLKEAFGHQGGMADLPDRQWREAADRLEDRGYGDVRLVCEGFAFVINETGKAAFAKAAFRQKND
jgi:hypothetical protein